MKCLFTGPSMNKIFAILFLGSTILSSFASAPALESIVLKDKQFLEFVPPTEDLMREHGVLHRLLLIYEAVIVKIEQNDFPVSALASAVTIMKSFIEDYHEKLEENYIFPIFTKKKKYLSLVRTLKNQHDRGRKITQRLRELTLRANHKEKNLREIKKLLRDFIKMYRPHAAREDTVLFPRVRELLTPKEFMELGELFEKSEEKLFHADGFNTIVKRVTEIEKELGIHRLDQFTP
jgi:hemerythrin-like domain-containing protein